MRGAPPAPSRDSLRAARSQALAGCGLLSWSPPATVAFNPAAPSRPGAGPSRPRCAHASTDTVARSWHASPACTRPPGPTGPPDLLSELPRAGPLYFPPLWPARLPVPPCPCPGAGGRGPGGPGARLRAAASPERGEVGIAAATGPCGLGWGLGGLQVSRAPLSGVSSLPSCLGQLRAHWPQAYPEMQGLGLVDPTGGPRVQKGARRKP